MTSKVTIKDIARRLNLTAATVSRALNDHPRISLRTKKAVLELAEKMEYRRNRVASSLRSGRTQTIGVIIPSAGISFFGSIVQAVETLASTHGYHMLLYQSNESPEFEKKAIETFISAKVDGILASLAKETRDFSHFLELKKQNIPLVMFDRTHDSLHFPSVVIDDVKGAFLATEHLIKQGCKRIAHISGQQHLKIFKDRFTGYRMALAEAGMAFDPSLLFKGDVSIEAGREAMDYFFQLPEPPDAVFAVEDFTALGVIKAAKEKKISVPAELAVIGFANESFCEHISPTLSSIDQQTAEMGAEACKLLFELINDKTHQEQKRLKIMLEPIPCLRESSDKSSLQSKQKTKPSRKQVLS